jgi:type I site-specific restriction-modification system R (restriction) subunit
VNVKDKLTKKVNWQEIRLRLCQAHAGCIAGRVIHRLHRDADREDETPKASFGDYVSIYDIEDAVDDKATVPIYYESRLAKLDINREEIDALNKNVEEVIEDEEDVAARENTKGKWAELAKLVGAK